MGPKFYSNVTTAEISLFLCFHSSARLCTNSIYSM